MLAVIFEVEPKEGHLPDYMGLAGNLRPLLETIDGFISVERFESLAQPGKLLSLSYWRDEEALAEWRRVEEHRQAQEAGRAEHFDAYRIRVATVIRDYTMTDRESVPDDSKARHG